MNPASSPFPLLGVAHLLQPWGEPATDLEQLRERLAVAPPSVLFVHVLQCQLRQAAAGQQTMDDVSHWVATAVHDLETAERMWFALASAEPGAEPARSALLEVLDRVPAGRRSDRRGPEGGPFTFLTAVSVTYPAGEPVESASGMMEALLQWDRSVWFHHLLEEPWGQGSRSSLALWLESRGEHRLARWLEESASSGLPLELARARAQRRWRLSQVARRVADGPAPGADGTAAVRRGATAVLARRLAGDERSA